MENTTTINILGSKYTVEIKKYSDDETFKRRSIGGYCDGYTKQIVICDMSTYEGWENEEVETCDQCTKLCLRHEIVHAFLNESGLQDNAHPSEYGWAKNEEMIDWIAIQGSKIYKVWEKAGAI